jgi:hypothetical protein
MCHKVRLILKYEVAYTRKSSFGIGVSFLRNLVLVDRINQWDEKKVDKLVECTNCVSVLYFYISYDSVQKVFP